MEASGGDLKSLLSDYSTTLSKQEQEAKAAEEAAAAKKAAAAAPPVAPAPAPKAVGRKEGREEGGIEDAWQYFLSLSSSHALPSLPTSFLPFFPFSFPSPP